MNELTIQYHDFENAKNEIKKFSEQTPTGLKLNKVDDSKRVGEFLGDLFLGRGIGLDHKVTGEELNELTSQIQKHLHSINDTQINLIKEFGQVYSALEALDKDYIQAILVSVKAAEETSEGVKKAQEQIKRVVENQRKTLEVLEKFRHKLDGYAHLSDIDKIWSDCQKWCKALEDQQYHLKYIDSVNEKQEVRLQSLSSENDKIADRVSANESGINNLNESIHKITSIVHMEDIDTTWDTVKEHSGQLTEIEKRNEAIASAVQKNKDDVEAKIAEANNGIASLTQKLKYAYWMAGGAAGLAIIELILLRL